MFLAAFWSLCRLVPQSGQLCQRTDKPFETVTPQPEHLWLANAGLTDEGFSPPQATPL
jgi:hypothetical protein